MKRKTIKSNKPTSDDMSLKEMQAMREDLNRERAKSKIDLADGRSLIKVEKTEEIEKPGFKPFLTEAQISKALRLTLGNHSQAGKLLGVSQSAISQRIGRSKKLQEVIRLTRQKYIDLAENIVLQRLKALDFDAATLVIRRLGYMRYWLERQEIYVDQRVSGGVLVVPAQVEDHEEWSRKAIAQQRELIQGTDNSEEMEEEYEDIFGEDNTQYGENPFGSG